MNQPCTLVISFFALFLSTIGYSQEEAPLKTFEFTITVNKLKTQDQANNITTEVKAIPGIKNAELVLINYELTFDCSNHDMNRYAIMDQVKEVIVRNGAEIITINRREK